jgi:hypothetical protein
MISKAFHEIILRIWSFDDFLKHLGRINPKKHSNHCFVFQGFRNYPTTFPLNGDSTLLAVTLAVTPKKCRRSAQW